MHGQLNGRFSFNWKVHSTTVTNALRYITVVVIVIVVNVTKIKHINVKKKCSKFKEIKIKILMY